MAEEKKKIHLPQVPKLVVEIKAKARECAFKIEKRLTTLTQRQLVVLAVAASFFAILMGAALGLLLTLYRPTATPGADLTTPSTTPSSQKISQSGVLRKFQTSQDGIDFYLEKQDNTQILLDITDRFDPAFLQQTYVGSTVTVKGIVTKTADGSKDILQVEEIVIKW